MNGYLGCNFLRSSNKDVSKLNDTPANLLVNIRSAGASFVSPELEQIRKQSHTAQWALKVRAMLHSCQLPYLSEEL